MTPEAIQLQGEKSEDIEFEPIPAGTIEERIQSAGIVGMGGAGFRLG
ncbi:hypothetical protein NBRC111894_3672 [Sporolactobacillus inulinus]|uniref:Uncharacterized protein n=1 Tax=Sporolactobacillus inulinus TaxID=2078 RepID=A0A4Y1ZID6_9BACL|nr:hypothetical protein NBRC111894_3672 [Sporolactobacillus inulinus]